MRRFKGLFLFIFLIFSINNIWTQTFGRLNITPQQVSSQAEVQALESFEEYFVLEKAVDPATYIIGPGDEFGINILTSESVTLPLKVSPTGDLLIPSVGIIKVGGMTLQEAIQTVQTFVKEKAYPNAKVNLSIVNIRIFLVQISGAVNGPGFYTITPCNRLHDVVSKARGFHQFAKEYNIKISRANGENIVTNYLDFLRDGSLTGNPTFLEGDKIFVPFGDVEKEGIVIRGSISGVGYDIIQKNETLGDFLQRRATFTTSADLNSVTITRMENGKELFMTVFPKDFHKTVLKPGDAIDILSERGVSVNGFVQAPGGFSFFPGYTYLDYINMAGGNTVEGDVDRAIVRHLDGTIEKSKEAEVKRGDVIIVPRTRIDVLFGDMSALQILSAITTVLLTFIAATKY